VKLTLNNMRVVATSNFNSETYCEAFKSERLSREDAQKLADDLNEKVSPQSESWHVVKEDDYVLHDTKNPNHPWYGL
jgi:hypothetical protein